jgi:drug/metabolite transporter (DMT)-like permease
MIFLFELVYSLGGIALIKEKRNIASLMIILAGACWGIIGFFSRNLNSLGLTSVQITAVRCIITALGLTIYLLIKDKEKLRINYKDIWYFIGTGICSILFFYICFFVTTELTTLSIASILLYTAPFFVTILSAIFFNEKMTKYKISALLLAFTGCILTTGIIGSGEMKISTLGLITGLGSGIGYALYSIFGTIALKKYDSFTVTTYTFIIASIAVLPFCSIENLIEMSMGNSKILINSILIAIVSTLIPFLLYTKGLGHIEAGQASIMAFVEPMAATAVGIIIFKEGSSIQHILGIFLIFISIVLLNIRLKPTK